MGDTVFVMFCCNDHRNGMPTGRIDALEAEGVCHLVGNASYRENGRSVKIGRFTYPLESGIGAWVGNWCWNGARMQVSVLAALLERLRQDGWDCEEGAEEIWHAISHDEPITEAMVRKAQEP